MPLLRGQLFHRYAGCARPGIVEQNVDIAETVKGLLDRRAALVGLPHVGLQKKSIAAVVTDCVIRVERTDEDAGSED